MDYIENENNNCSNNLDGNVLINSDNYGSIHCLTIIGQIEGHQILHDSIKTTRYEHVMPLLAAIEESSDIHALLILLNTVGGDVEAGLGIAELIAGMKKPTASVVLGGSHSIGVPLAVAAKRSYIAPSAAMIIHPVRHNGTIIAAPQSFAYLQKMQERVAGFVVRNSNISMENYTTLMLKNDELAGDTGSILGAEDAVNCGLIDSIGTLSNALNYLHEEIDNQKAEV